MNQIIEKDIEVIYTDIKGLINNSRKRVYQTVNTEMLHLYWSIGKIIVNIQDGEKRAKYERTVLKEISERLTREFRKGFSKRNLERMRNFYLCFPNTTTLLSQLSWSHYIEIIKIKNKYKRDFYLHEVIHSNWSVRELQRQISSLLYERLTIF